MSRSHILVALVVSVSLSACDRARTPQTQPAAGKQAGSTQRAESEVVVYTALDRQFSEPILADFTAKTGIRVNAVYDTESTKTVGLANRLRAEANRPRCDVYWNNEILNTLRLGNEGLFQETQIAEALNYPPESRDPNGRWYGFAARARVIIVNAELVKPEDMPTSIRDLALERWRGRAGIAKPLFGTTASHVAALFALLGEDQAKELLAALKRNDIQVLGGNKSCAEAVGAGRLALALTDTDDALEELAANHPVRIVFPDAGEGHMGTLLLPNTLSLVRGCPHPEAGKRLMEYLLSAEVEGRLAAGPSGQLPLNRNATVQSRAGAVKDLTPMKVDYAKAAELFPVAAKYIEKEFLAP